MMKTRYIDHYGIDSLPHLKTAAFNGIEVFVTTNRALLADRKELEALFRVKIRAPEEILAEMDSHPEMKQPAVEKETTERKIAMLKKFDEFTKNSTLTEEDTIRLGRKVNKALAKRYRKMK